MTLTISLPPALEDMVRAKVASGTYASVSEVVREALRDKQERERQLEALRAEIQKGIDSGPGIPADEVYKEVEDYIDSL